MTERGGRVRPLHIALDIDHTLLHFTKAGPNDRVDWSPRYPCLAAQPSERWQKVKWGVAQDRDDTHATGCIFVRPGAIELVRRMRALSGVTIHILSHGTQPYVEMVCRFLFGDQGKFINGSLVGRTTAMPTMKNFDQVCPPGVDHIAIDDLAHAAWDKSQKHLVLNVFPWHVGPDGNVWGTELDAIAQTDTVGGIPGAQYQLLAVADKVTMLWWYMRETGAAPTEAMGWLRRASFDPDLLAPTEALRIHFTAPAPYDRNTAVLESAQQLRWLTGAHGVDIVEDESSANFCVSTSQLGSVACLLDTFYYLCPMYPAVYAGGGQAGGWQPHKVRELCDRVVSICQAAPPTRGIYAGGYALRRALAAALDISMSCRQEVDSDIAARLSQLQSRELQVCRREDAVRSGELQLTRARQQQSAEIEQATRAAQDRVNQLHQQAEELRALIKNCGEQGRQAEEAHKQRIVADQAEQREYEERARQRAAQFEENGRRYEQAVQLRRNELTELKRRVEEARREVQEHEAAATRSKMQTEQQIEGEKIRRQAILRDVKVAEEAAEKHINKTKGNQRKVDQELQQRKEELSRFKEEIIKQRKRTDLVRAATQAAEAELRSTDAKRKSERAELAALEKQHATVLAAIRDPQSVKKRLEEEIQKLQEQKQQLTKEAEEVERKMAGRKKKLEESLQAHTLDIEAKKNKATEAAEESMKALRQRKSEAEAAATAAERAAHKRKTEAEQAAVDAEKSAEARIDEANESAETTERISKQRVEMAESKLASAELRSAEADKAARKLEDRAAGLRGTVEELERQANESRAAEAKAEAERRRRAAAATQEINSLMSELQARKAENAAGEAEQQRAETSRREAQAACEAARAELDSTRAKYQARKLEAVGDLAELEEEEKRREKRQAEVKAAQAELERTAADVQKRQQQAAREAAELEERAAKRLSNHCAALRKLDAVEAVHQLRHAAAAKEVATQLEQLAAQSAEQDRRRSELAAADQALACEAESVCERRELLADIEAERQILVRDRLKVLPIKGASWDEAFACLVSDSEHLTPTSKRRRLRSPAGAAAGDGGDTSSES